MVSEDSLRFSDAAFLNDRTERNYALAVARDVLRAATKRRGSSVQLLSLMIEYLTPEVWFTRMYVCSLSETPASISQWQRYGADGYGYCVGFDANALSRRYLAAGVELRRMIYATNAQRELVASRLRQVLAMFASGEIHRDLRLRRDGDIDDVAPHLTIRLAETLLELKNPQFAEELEWRLISEALEHDQVEFAWQNPQFAPRGMYIKPFVVPPLTVVGRHMSRLPIVAIVCGPRLDGDLAEASVMRFLRTHGLGSVKVEISALRHSWR